MSTAAVRHPIQKRSETGSVALSPPPTGTPVPLSHNHQVAAATFATWAVTVPSHYGIADLLAPALWRNVELVLRDRAGRPKVGDIVRCTADDGSFDAFFTIKAVDRGYQLVYSHGRLPEVGTP